MAKLVDGQGEEAVVGRVGYWLDSGDFVSTADLDAEHIGQIGFPRDWPGVYGSSKALKQLVGKKGKCAGKKVGVVPLPDASQLSLVKRCAISSASKLFQCRASSQSCWH